MPSSSERNTHGWRITAFLGSSPDFWGAPIMRNGVRRMKCCQVHYMSLLASFTFKRIIIPTAVSHKPFRLLASFLMSLGQKWFNSGHVPTQGWRSFLWGFYGVFILPRFIDLWTKYSAFLEVETLLGCLFGLGRWYCNTVSTTDTAQMQCHKGQ